MWYTCINQTLNLTDVVRSNQLRLKLETVPNTSVNCVDDVKEAFYRHTDQRDIYH